MPIASYTDAATVAAALRILPDTALAAAVLPGATSLSLNANQTTRGIPLYPGMYLALDQFNPGAREVVQITAAVTGTGPYTVPVTATTYAHGSGAPATECSAIQDVVGAASRLVDDATFSAAGAFAQQAWSETVNGQVTADGRIFCQVSGRGVSAFSAFSWQVLPTDTAQVVPTSSLRWDDYQVWALPNGVALATGEPAYLPINAAEKALIVTVAYTAGYSPLPDDLARAATVLAARLFKEGESGFSDTVGDPQLGVLTYKKGIPADIAAILKPWRRWS